MLRALFETNRSRIRTFLLCAATAALYGLAAPSMHWHILCWVLLVPMLEALDGKDLRGGFSVGWLSGTLMHMICFYWVIGTVQRYSNLNLSLSVLAWILFAAYSGLAFGAMTLLYRFLTVRLALPGVVTLPACYTAMEFLFPYIFPWHLGAVLYGVTPFIQISDLFGVYGVTALLVLVNHSCWDLLRFFQKKRSFPLFSFSLALLLVVSAWAYGAWRMHTLETVRAEARKFTVGMIQPNIRIEEKRTRLLQEDIWTRYRKLSGQAVKEGAELIVWPESAIHFPFRPHSISFSNSAVLKRLAENLARPLLFGTWSMGPGGAHNTAYLLNEQGAYAGRYDKVRLLAFGEYLPFSDWFPQMKEWIRGVGDFEPGENLDPLCTGDVCFGVLICYEAILDGLSRDFINRGSKFLVNITNDVWFGETSCPEQHLMLASLRAVENRVWMVRVANTGISACVDPFGRIHCRTPLFEQAQRVCEVELLDVPSLYRKWGDWFPIFCSGLCFLLVLTAIVLKRN